VGIMRSSGVRAHRLSDESVNQAVLSSVLRCRLLACTCGTYIWSMYDFDVSGLLGSYL
jgi:hypothetical protein